MKPIALIILAVTLILGTFLSRKEEKRKAQLLIEDTVGSRLAAPVRPIKPEIPF